MRIVSLQEYDMSKLEELATTGQAAQGHFEDEERDEDD